MENTAKHFAIQLGAVISLYVSLTAFVVLAFGIITLSIPDPAESAWAIESAMSSIRFAVATLLIFFPAYIALTRIVNKERRKGKGDYLPLTKWILYLSLLLAALVLLGNFATTIYTFLNGELTTRFLLKAATLTLVIGAAFYYYLKDARQFWHTNEKMSIYFGAVVGAVVVLLIIIGLVLIDSPTEVRESRIDQKQVQDLTEIQWRIEEVIRTEGALRNTLSDYYEELPVPTAPEGRDPYRYRVTQEGFELCATFATASDRRDGIEFARPTIREEMPIRNPYDWEHPAGDYCFERIVELSETNTSE